MKNIVIIGFGDMGKAFYQGLKSVDGIGISAINRTPQKVLEAECRLANEKQLQAADIVIITVKPHQLKDLSGLSFSLDSIIISALAGISLEQLQQTFPKNKVLRCMPNLAIASKQGVITWYASSVSQANQEKVKDIFKHLGLSLLLESEALLDKSTLISGSGPGYIAYFADLLEQEATNLGFEPEAARRLVMQTFVGTATHLKAGMSPLELVHRVSSPNGVTEEITQAFKENGLKNIISKALTEGLNKINQLKS